MVSESDQSNKAPAIDVAKFLFIVRVRIAAIAPSRLFHRAVAF